MITDPEALGTLKSVPRDLWGVLTGALDVVAAPALGRLLDVNVTTTVDDQGVLRHAAAPTPPTSVTDRARDALSNPFIVAGLIAAAVALVVVLVRR